MRISDWSSDVCSSDLLPKRSAGFSYSCWTAKTIGSGAGSLVTRTPPMPHSTRSSSASAPCRPPVDASGCRIQRRASPQLVADLLPLALDGEFAVLVSKMPLIDAWPLALAALGRQSVVEGKRVSVRVKLVGRTIKKK